MAQDLENYKFAPRKSTPNLVLTPTFPTGDFGRTFYNAMIKDADENFEGNKHLKPYSLNEETGEVSGSNIFAVIRASQVLSSQGLNVHPALPEEITPEILEMIKGKNYVNLSALILRSTEDSFNSRNNSNAKSLAEHVDLSKSPALLTGLEIEHWPEDNDNGHGLKFILGSNFKATHDDRLLGRWDGYKFNTTDSTGLPEHLDKTNGSRTWHTRDNGLSRLFLSRDLGLYSGGGNLPFSVGGGRVVLVGGEAGAQNI